MSSATSLAAQFSQKPAAPPLDVYRIREDFPILTQTVHGKPLVYLDNAASSQKPRAVIDAVAQVYEEYYSNIHRGVHYLSQRATEAYEAAREKVRSFVNAPVSSECIFVRNATEGINLVAYSFGKKYLKPGDEILITAMEHHANIVPWQIACEDRGATLRVAPINDDGELIFDEFVRLIGPKTKIVAVSHLSNALGTINPIRAMIEAAHERGVPVLIDAAQSAPHLALDVQALDCDFLVFSGHKMFGPTGIGILYGKSRWLNEMPPYQGGGDMILSVTFEKTTFNTIPHKFEAGTPNIVDAIGLGAAIDYLQGIGLDAIAAYEHDLLEYATEAVTAIPEVRLIGTAREKASVLSMVIGDVHPHDVGTILDRDGIAIRAGNHCAQPVMERFGVSATARASLAFYNTREEIDTLVAGIHHVLEVFA